MVCEENQDQFPPSQDTKDNTDSNLPAEVSSVTTSAESGEEISQSEGEVSSAQAQSSEEIDRFEGVSDESGREEADPEQKQEQSDEEIVTTENKVPSESVPTNDAPADRIEEAPDSSLGKVDRNAEPSKADATELIPTEDREEPGRVEHELSELKRQMRELQGEVSRQTSQLEEKIAQLEGKNAQLEEKIARSDPKYQLVDRALVRAEEEYQSDSQELNTHEKKAQHWLEQGKQLQQGIETAVEAYDRKLSECERVRANLPSHLPESLQTRYEALALTGRMLRRLPEQMDRLAKGEIPSTPLPIIDQQDLMGIISEESDLSLAEKAIEQKLKEVGNERWQDVSKSRDRAERYCKGWLSFVETKVLPILDGIDDGERYSQPLVEELQKNFDSENSEFGNLLNDWLQTYSYLREILLETLHSVQVRPMKIERGMPIDFNRCEPSDTERDDELPHESVKEVTRKGYEYKEETSQGWLVLRSAQVVAVKNN